MTGSSVGKINGASWRVTNLRVGSNAPCRGKVFSSSVLSAAAAAKALKATPCPQTSSQTLLVCCNCSGETPVNEAVSCKHYHHYCQTCFGVVANNSLVGEYRSRFIAGNCKMICEYCPPSANSEFDMHASASKLKADAFENYLSCMSELAVINTQQEYEKRMASMLQEKTQTLIAEKPDAAKIG